MEEKSIINTSHLQMTASDWKLKHNLYQSYRNYRQLENRVSILQLEKKKKLKNIQNKLNQHKKFVETKIYKHQLKNAIDNRNNTQMERSNSNSRIFRSERQSRSVNIRKQHDDLLMTRHKFFQETKQNRMENEKKILINKLNTMEEKVKKRNRVRLIEIQSKENIENFWNSKLQTFQDDKRLDMTIKLQKQQNKLKQLQQMEESENALLEEIRKAEQIESELSNLIDVERNMNGGNLNDLYLSKLTINE